MTTLEIKTIVAQKYKTTIKNIIVKYDEDFKTNFIKLIDSDEIFSIGYEKNGIIKYTA